MPRPWIPVLTAIALIACGGCQPKVVATKAPFAPPTKHSKLYLAILASVPWPAEHTVVNPKQIDWTESDTDLTPLVKKRKGRTPLPSGWMLDHATIKAIESGGHRVVQGLKLAELNSSVDRLENSVWRFSEPIETGDGKMLVLSHMYCGSLCAGTTLYVLEHRLSNWKVSEELAIPVS